LSAAPRIVCGIDFDNTIISYDVALAGIARERGLADLPPGASKKAIRDEIRRRPDGENEWRECQGLLYGARMNQAELIAGAADFFRLCAQREAPVYIISHKTTFSPFDPGGVNLQETARAWMASHGFFTAAGFGLPPSHVFFEESREGKINRIAALDCTHFVDDLEEVFLETLFPARTRRILYEPGRETAPPAGVMLARHWNEISRAIFQNV